MSFANKHKCRKTCIEKDGSNKRQIECFGCKNKFYLHCFGITSIEDPSGSIFDSFFKENSHVQFHCASCLTRLKGFYQRNTPVVTRSRKAPSIARNPKQLSLTDNTHNVSNTSNADKNTSNDNPPNAVDYNPNDSIISKGLNQISNELIDAVKKCIQQELAVFVGDITSIKNQTDNTNKLATKTLSFLDQLPTTKRVEDLNYNFISSLEKKTTEITDCIRNQHFIDNEVFQHENINDWTFKNDSIVARNESINANNRTDRSHRRMSMIIKQSVDDDIVNIVKMAENRTWDTLDIMNKKLDAHTECLGGLSTNMESLEYSLVHHNEMILTLSNKPRNGIEMDLDLKAINDKISAIESSLSDMATASIHNSEFLNLLQTKEPNCSDGAQNNAISTNHNLDANFTNEHFAGANDFVDEVADANNSIPHDIMLTVGKGASNSNTDQFADANDLIDDIAGAKNSISHNLTLTAGAVEPTLTMVNPILDAGPSYSKNQDICELYVSKFSNNTDVDMIIKFMESRGFHTQDV